MTTTAMPERRPGQETITLYVSAQTKENFKRLCSIKGTTMTEEIVRFIEETNAANAALLKLVDEKLNVQGKSK